MKYKLWLLFLVVILGLSGFLFYSFYGQVKKNMIEELNARQLIHAKQATKSIEDFFDHYLRELTRYSEKDYIITLNQEGRKIMELYYIMHPDEIAGVTRVDEKGRITYTVPYDPKFIGRDITSQKHIQEMMRIHQPVISDVFTTIQGFEAIAVHVPVSKNGNFKGTLAILIRFEPLVKKYLKEIKIGEDGYAWMLSKEGIELYCPVPGHTGKSVFENCKDFPDIISMAKEMIKGKQGVTTYHFSKIREKTTEPLLKHAVYLPMKIGNTFWSIVVATPEREVLTTIEGFKRNLYLIFSILLLGSIFFSYYSAKAWGILKEEKRRRQAEEALQKSEKEARHLAQENLVMAEIGKIISSTLNIEEVYDHFAKEVKKLIPFDRVVINMINIEKNTVVNVYMTGQEVLHRKVGEVYPLEGSGSVEMVRTKSAFLLQTEDMTEVKDRFPGLLSTFQAGFRSIINIPLFSKREMIGGLLLRSLKPYVYTDEHLRLGERVGVQIAGAISNAQLYLDRKRAEESLRETEELYRTILHTSPDGISVTDMEGRLTFVSERMLGLFGLIQPEDVIGHSPLDFIAPEDHARFMLIIQGVFKNNYTSYNQYTLLKKDGTKFIGEINSSLLHDASGKPRGIISITRDVTDRKRAEEEREKLIQELQEALTKVKMLSGFLPICMSCKKIRDDKGYWNQLEAYIRDHSEAEFTHGICPECKKKLYGDF